MIVDAVERSGLALAASGLLWAPLTARRCLGYVATVEEPGLLRPNILALEQASAPFVLEDGTQVEDTVVIHTGVQRYFETGHLRDPGELLQGFLLRHGCSHVDFLGLNRTLRYREGILLPGDRVRVRGIATWQPSPAGSAPGGYRNAPQCLVLRKCTIFVDQP